MAFAKVAATVLLGVSPAIAVPVQWTVASGGNGGYYERIDTTGQLTWQQARDAAAGSTYNGLPGHLVIFDNPQYSAELAFVNQSVYGVINPNYLDAYWIGAFRPSNTSISNRNGWFWLDGSPVPTSVTNNWFIDQNEGAGDESAVLYQPNSQPGDYGVGDQLHIIKGFIVEYGNALVTVLPGDANRNGRIDPDDFALTDRGHALGLTGWANGDFNDDGAVNAADYALLDQSFRNQGGGAFAADLAGAVPEPSACTAGLLGVFGLQRRTRNGMRRAMS